jgi:hypothetical protein
MEPRMTFRGPLRGLAEILHLAGAGLGDFPEGTPCRAVSAMAL